MSFMARKCGETVNTIPWLLIELHPIPPAHGSANNDKSNKECTQSEQKRRKKASIRSARGNSALEAIRDTADAS